MSISFVETDLRTKCEKGNRAKHDLSQKVRIIFLNAGIACGRKRKAPRVDETPGRADGEFLWRDLQPSTDSFVITLHCCRQGVAIGLPALP
jgi:hypothetical protein